MKKIHTAKKNNYKEIVIWGDGSPKRELIYVDDIADACVFFINKKIKETMINVGTGKDYSIRQYADMISKVINPNNNLKFKFDKKKPNGTPRKVLNIDLAKKYGWRAKTDLKEAIFTTYQDFLYKNK